MLVYTADNRDGSGADGCTTCCCTPMSVKPGETNKIVGQYAGWVAPIGGRGLIAGTQFSIVRTALVPAGLSPVNTDYNFATVINTLVGGNVAINAVDPGGLAMTYSVVPLYAPVNGVLVMAGDGVFSYAPNLGFIGYDSFVYQTTDGINPPTLNTVRIAVSAALPSPALPPMLPPAWLAIPPASVRIQGTALVFALTADPELPVGSIWRLTIRQPAFDCSTVFTNISCLDITAGGC